MMQDNSYRHIWGERLALFCTLFFLGQIVLSQITSSTPYFDTTGYSVGPQDKIYIFYKEGAEENDSVGDLSVASLVDTAEADFQWFRFDSISQDFIPLPKFDVHGTESHIYDMPSGGYKVNITNSIYPDTSFIAWVFVTYLNVTINYKEKDGTYNDDIKQCYYLGLEGVLEAPGRFYYYDFNDSDFLALHYTVDVLWTYESEDGPETDLQGVNTLEPETDNLPYDDVVYTVNIYDNYQYRNTPVTDEVLYESITPGAYIEDPAENKYIEVKGSHEYDKPERLPGPDVGFSAPAKAIFPNSSKNSAEYIWILVDTVKYAYDPNYIVKTRQKDTLIEYTYYYPRGDSGYTVKLIAISERGCEDIVESKIIIRESDLIEPPNVVCPDCDEEYTFGIENYSIKKIRVRIYDRWGKKVHDYEGGINTWNDGKGWDGLVKGGKREAAPGQYFYVIEATGWDNIRHELPGDEKTDTSQPDGANEQTSVLKGSFYLFWQTKRKD